MTETPLYPLAEFTPEEAAKLAEFEAAPTPPEVLRERLRLDFEAELQKVLMQRVAAEFAGRLADAALAVFRGQQDPAVQRVLELADMVERDALESAEPENPDGAEHVRACALLLVSHSIRAAIGGDGR